MKILHSINKIAEILTKPIRENMAFFCFMYLLCMLTMMIEVTVLGFKIPRITFFTSFFDIYLCCVIISLLPKKLKRTGRIVIAAVAYVLSIVNAFCVDNFHAKIGPEILNVVLETNPRESSEFVDKYILSPSLFTSPVMLIALLVIAQIIWGLRKKRQTGLATAPSPFVSWGLVAILLATTAISLGTRTNMVRLMTAEDTVEADKYISNYSLNTPLNNLLFAVKVRMLANKDLGVLAENQKGMTVDSCAYTSPMIVLVIGESYVKCHSGLYDYPLPTTPYQKARAESGQLTVFSDVISPANLTSVVFKNTFSLHSIDDSTNWADYPLFPVLFRRAGYHVTFMTNQFVKSITQDAFNVTGGLFLNDDRLSADQFDCRNIESHQFDEGLLADYDSLKQYNTDHNLVFFHLAGQHIDFDKRCPDSLKKFTKADYANRSDLNDGERQIVADYDNATLYNDYVLEKILQYFENDDAIVIYMPDHGEECYDELHRMGRLPSGNFSPEVLRQEYRIPFWIWCSDKYAQNHPQIVEMIRAAKDRPFMTDDLPHLMLYLAGIQCKYYDDRKNIISENFDAGRKRMVEGKKDYDLIVGQSKKTLETTGNQLSK